MANDRHCGCGHVGIVKHFYNEGQMLCKRCAIDFLKRPVAPVVDAPAVPQPIVFTFWHQSQPPTAIDLQINEVITANVSFAERMHMLGEILT